MAHKYMNVVSVKKNGFNNLKINKIMEQSAVEWLVNKLNLFNITKEEHYEILCQIELEAKEMEKQQQDELAIGFVKWVVSPVTSDLLHDLEIVGEIDVNITPEKLLEIYKKEKGL